MQDLDLMNKTNLTETQVKKKQKKEYGLSEID